MKGKVALITGASSGIGLGIAKYLATKGCDIIKTGLASKEVIDQLADDFKRSYEGKSVFINSDLSKVKSTMDLCNDINKHYPNGIDIIVNNAGIQHVCMTDNYPIEKWHDMLAIHLTAPFLICRHFIPFMKDKVVAKTLSNVAKEQNRPFEEVKKEFFRDIHPIKKPVTIQEVSSLVGHLCSKDASSITGSVFTIDGGYTAR